MQHRLKRFAPARRPAEPHAGGLASELADFGVGKSALLRSNALVQLYAGLAAKCFQPRREGEIPLVTRTVEEMYTSARATVFRQHPETRQKGRNANAPGNPDLILGSVAEIETAVGAFDDHRVAGPDTAGQGARVIAERFDGETELGARLPLRNDREGVRAFVAIQREQGELPCRVPRPGTPRRNGQFEDSRFA